MNQGGVVPVEYRERQLFGVVVELQRADAGRVRDPDALIALGPCRERLEKALLIEPEDPTRSARISEEAS